ncbi:MULTISPECIES: arylamine N-acetyltransferase family protein [Streptomyces]|uniref:arylamine N-acetyltransferase family protein n=1 Tax=Streptomyces TaxID=1883 RepID=UPI001E2FE328|nr:MULTISPECIES: arylamine N-acetyltransferase [Streptomyces]UFQ18474.1 arylamine N-acetyltransferase [Streptomyces huasconensis]WCL88086.1 arylamine N-acetyltransferase [Streptomyces sp. JCM 35825]
MTWNGEELDIEAYLARLGHTGGAKPDLDSLRALHRAHVAAIPFENLEMMLGRPVPLDLSALQDKMVRGRRGGYCYEQNLLFAAALERIGFSVTGLGARVRAGASTTRAVTHMLLKVEVDGEEWHCDVGFGADGLLEPIPLRDGAEMHQGEWRFQLHREDTGVLVLRTWRSGGWFDLYAYTLEPRLPVDYVVMNHYTATHPKSSFIRRPVVQRAAPEVRRRLVGDRLSRTRPDGSLDEQDVPVGELTTILAREFGIELEAADAAELIRVHYAGA